MKTVVKMFQPRFHEAVQSGAKRQTIRRIPKRPRDMPVPGNKFSGRKWNGEPYKSKQSVLREGVVTAVTGVCIDHIGITVGERVLNREEANELARADGFNDETEMLEWFSQNHGDDFTGILIEWDPA